MKKTIIIVLLILASLPVRAEYCWMIDCPGYIGYVYIPRIAIGGTKNLEVIHRGKVQYTITGKENVPFVEMTDGLPDVNQIVTISGDTTGFDWNSHIPKIAERLKAHKDYEFSEELKEARINIFRGAGFPMASGAKVKILGYRHFDIAGIEDKLFAQIIYISDK